MAKLSVVVPSNEVEVEGAKYRKVERKAQAGDIVKITDAHAPSYVVNGAFYEVKNVDRDGDPQITDEDGDKYYLYEEKFEVYEKVTEPAAVEYREVKRVAQVGERIKIIKRWPNEDRYVVGDVFVTSSVRQSDGYVRVDSLGERVIALEEYVVLEPVNVARPAEPVPQPERLKVGEYAKVVGSSHRSFFGGKDGDIVSIVRESDSRYKCERVDGYDYRGNPWADPESLIRATEAEVEAAKKALERTKNIGEFADGGYAVVKSDADGYLSGGYRGAYVKVRPTLTEGPYALEISLSEQRGYSAYCNADALRKVSREEYEEATNPKPAFNVGDYAKVIRDNHEHRVGHIVKITEGTSRIFDFAVKRITYGGNGYIDAKNIEKVSAEEVARIEEEAKWAAIDRKVGEYKRGDIVEAKQYSGRGEQIYGKVEDVGREGELLGLRLPNGRYNVVYVEGAKLIVPVEQRFDRAEGGASTSK
ncbi:hypothetical protein [Brevibacillus reuszeri]|uniref:hypothetical protein n=1 Tax=Brevibacillus reuszeri TaxID=54915 RepID=UPI000CCC42B5|nr:hypothetical protein [Brevibacillus reuszeri]